MSGEKAKKKDPRVDDRFCNACSFRVLPIGNIHCSTCLDDNYDETCDSDLDEDSTERRLLGDNERLVEEVSRLTLENETLRQRVSALEDDNRLIGHAKSVIDGIQAKLEAGKKEIAEHQATIAKLQAEKQAYRDSLEKILISALLRAF